MRHLTITQFGSFIGLDGQRLVVKKENQVVGEYPINRLKTLQITTKGVGLSSNLLYELSLRGVNVFFIDYRNIPVMAISGTHHHAVVELRKKQFEFGNSHGAIELSKRIVLGKIRNQRAVLLYFAKQTKRETVKDYIIQSIQKLEKSIYQIKEKNFQNIVNWKEFLMGFEGAAAQIYWNGLKNSELLPYPFQERKGRGAIDVVNQCLNFGYAILMSYIWNAVLKAGLEPYFGFYHVTRPGKPSLVLDIMEEYRAWVVDRNIIKLRFQLTKESSLNQELKNRIIKEVHESFSKKYKYNGKLLKLETMLQRQVYRLCGFIYGNKKYKHITFKW